MRELVDRSAITNSVNIAVRRLQVLVDLDVASLLTESHSSCFQVQLLDVCLSASTDQHSFELFLNDLLRAVFFVHLFDQSTNRGVAALSFSSLDKLEVSRLSEGKNISSVGSKLLNEHPGCIFVFLRHDLTSGGDGDVGSQALETLAQFTANRTATDDQEGLRLHRQVKYVL